MSKRTGCCRKSAQETKSGERSEKSGTRRPHRLFHHENDTPVLVQAALLPIELSKPTTSHQPLLDVTPERNRTSVQPGQPSTLSSQPSSFSAQPSTLPGPPSAYSGQPSTYPCPPSSCPGQPAAQSSPQLAVPGQPSTYSGQPTALPGQSSALPGQPSALPGQSSSYSGQPPALPAQSSALAGQSSALPGPPSAHPGQFSTYPGPQSSLPSPSSAYPGQPSALPGPSSAYPGQPSALPGPSSAYPGPSSTFSGPPQTYNSLPPALPGPSSAYSSPPASYIPPQPFLPPAKLATVDHTTIPPPPQETSTPYGGGQPPARAANPPVAFSTPQTPPYNNQPQPYPYPQPTQGDDCQTPPQPGYMPPRGITYSQPAQPINQPIPQPIPSPQNQPIPQSQNQTIPQSQNQPIPQSQNQPVPQPRPRPPVPPQPNSLPQPAAQSPIQSRSPNPQPPRTPVSSSRISEAGRNSSIPQPYSSPRITTYPPARPVLPMPKPPPHLLHIIQQQEEQRKQQQYFLLQQQLQSLQHQVIEENQQREATRQRSSTTEPRPCDLERDSDDAENQSIDVGRPSLKQRPRLNKRIVTVSPHRSTPPTQAPQPANSPPSTSNPNQKICTVPPHPYGTIIPRFSTQHAFNVSQGMPNLIQSNRIPLTYSAQPPPRPEYLQSPLPGPTVNRPPNTGLASYYQNPPSKPPEATTRNTICQTDPILEEYPSKPQGCPAKNDSEVREAASMSPVSEQLHPGPQATQSESLQPPHQTQGIQARLSHTQPLHSPALQTTHVMGSIQMIQSPPVCAQGKEDVYVPAYSMQPAHRTSISERNSGQNFLQQQQSYLPPWQQLRQTPSPQYIQLGTFPPSMATFAMPPGGGFVQTIAERPLKLSLPSQVQTTQLYPQNFSNVGVGIRSANSCPGDVRIGAFHSGLIHGHRPGSPHHTRARSAGRVSVSESTASVWGSSSNPHHLP